MIPMIELYIRQGFPCLFQLLTGLYCPGCGGTRAVKYLLQGQIVKSIQYHPVVCYAAVIVAAAAVRHLLARIFHRPSLRMVHYDRYVYVGAAVIVANWIVKNFFLIVYGIDLLSERL